MKKIPFIKSTSCGNNFVIVDETSLPTQRVKESEKSQFACQATSINFGVGADGVLFLQSCRPEVLEEINSVRHYWPKRNPSLNADHIFRIFEPNGEESFSCGNGLLCIANYLYEQYGRQSTRVVTQIPASQPRVITMGTNREIAVSWANMGAPRKVPADLASSSIRIPYDNRIDMIKDLEVNFRTHDLKPFVDDTLLRISGYLVFAGEPHLVIFQESGMSLDKLAKIMFISAANNTVKARGVEKRGAFGTWFIHQIGTFINRQYASFFPSGINIDFVRVIDECGIIEHRCFERGINKETLACGTGAVASSFVAHRLKKVVSAPIIVWPHRCRWHRPQAQIYIRADETDWFLHGVSERLCEGDFRYHQPEIEQEAPSNSVDIDASHGAQPINNIAEHIFDSANGL